MYQEMIEYVRNYFPGQDLTASDLPTRFPFRDRFEHTLRVYQWAQRINRREKGDKVIVLTAAIFHDIGKAVESDLPHAQVSAALCEEYLRKTDFPADKVDRVLRAIKLHSSKGVKDLDLTKEDKILMDADLCDEVGATAVLWDSMAVGLEEAPSYKKAYERHLVYYDKLKAYRKQLKTDTGKRFYDKRLDFLGRFIKELKYELGI